MINYETKKYGLLGVDIKLSKSYELYYRFKDIYNDNIAYLPLEIKNPDMLQLFFESMKLLNFQGFNVTFPYKEKIVPYLDALDDSCRDIQAVNTVKITDNKFIGYNTDVLAVTNALENCRCDFFVIIGAGGYAKAILHSIIQKYPTATIMIINRTKEKILQMIRNINSKNEILAYSFDEVTAEVLRRYCDFDKFIFQATTVVDGIDNSIGFLENDKKTDLFFSNVLFAQDAVYYHETNFFKEAKKRNINAKNGYELLETQAKYAYEIWTGNKIL